VCGSAFEQLRLEDLVVEILDLGADVAPGSRPQPCSSISASVAARHRPVTSV